LLFVLSLLACTSGKDDTGEAAIAAPAISWLTPTDGATVTAGDVDASLVVDEFTLQDPAKHNEGAPEGYIDVAVDGTSAVTTGTTTFTLTLAAGAHDLTAQLFYTDGDEVSATSTALCDEDDTDPACAPVLATISVTAE
jgi:hypothetical protein